MMEGHRKMDEELKMKKEDEMRKLMNDTVARKIVGQHHYFQ